MTFGFLGEMITAYLVRESDTYSIAEHTAPPRGSRTTHSGKASETP